MEKVLLKPLRTEVQYQGQYAALAFRLLANPIPVYEALLQTLGPHGASLRDLRYETTNLPEANISCDLLNLSVTVRVRLDRLEVTFLRLDMITEERAQQLVVDAWRAVALSQESIQLVHHAVAVASHVELSSISYNDLLRRYVVTPSSLAAVTGSGLIFYFGEDPSRGEKGGSILLDRSVVKDGGLFIKVAVVFDAVKVPIEVLGARVDEYFTRQLSSLGLEIERTNRQ